MKKERIQELASRAATHIDQIDINYPVEVELYLKDWLTRALEEQRSLCVECDEPAGRHQIRCTDCHEAMEASLKMSVAEAEKIVGDCIRATMWERLWQSDQSAEPPDLSGYSLGRMLEANRRLEEERKGSKVGVSIGGKPPSKVLHMTCDDRLTAALYVATHWPAQPVNDPQPIVLLPGIALICAQAQIRKYFRDPDPDHDCELYIEGPSEPGTTVRDCQGDGHHMCDNCQRFDREKGED